MVIRKFELVFIIVASAALGNWLFSDKYQAESVFTMICCLAIASIYILLTQPGKIYRIFASFSLTVIAAIVGIVVLRLSGMTG